MLSGLLADTENILLAEGDRENPPTAPASPIEAAAPILLPSFQNISKIHSL